MDSAVGRGEGMSALRGRPERQDASKLESPKARKAAMSDEETVKVTTRLSNAQHRKMKIAAALSGMSIEDVYREAVDKYLADK